MSYVYHLMPRQMQGDQLLPLNQLKADYPSLYAQHMQKYEGREGITARKIPLLDCLWNDVLFFCPVHPEAIKRGFLEVGKTWRPKPWAQVDVRAAGFNSTNAVMYDPDSGREMGDLTLSPDRFQPFVPDALSVIHELPAESLAYYRECVAQGKEIFAWRGLPHVLFRGAVALDDVNVIEV